MAKRKPKGRAKAANPAEVLSANRRKALQIAERDSKKRSRVMFESAQRELMKRLAARQKLLGTGDGTFTTAQMKVTLAQLQDTLQSLQPKLKGELVSSSKRAALDQAQGQLEYLERSERKFRGINARLPINKAAALNVATRGVEATVLGRIAANPADPRGIGILNRYSQNVMKAFGKTLMKSVLTRQSWGEVRAELINNSTFLQGEGLHWAERIVRTESMSAANQAGQSIAETAETALGDVVKILAATFDDRTGWDSYQVHGQIRRTSEAFEWDGGMYMHPPNRPNDREIVVSHRLVWPIPAYLEWRDDSEVDMAWSEAGRKGSPPPRPEMTTVPLDRFASA